MARLSKSDLKDIVKECLVEILQEGISTSKPTGVSHLSENRTRGRSRRGAFDHVEWRKNQEPAPAVDYRETASQLASDPILASVLADSASTMQEQIMAENRGPSAMSGDSAARKAAMSDPEDLFGEAAGKWAHLAFE